MDKKRISLYLLASITAGLLMSACAGYATSQFTPERSTVISGPTIELWQLPILVTADQATTQTHLTAIHKSFSTYQTAEQVQTLIQGYGHLCSRP